MNNPYKSPKTDSFLAQEIVQSKRYSIMKKLSLIYLILGSLSVIGYIGFFQRWPVFPWRFLFVISLPYYFSTLTFTIFIHPFLCFYKLFKKRKNKEKVNVILLHFLWSLSIAIVFTSMVLNGYNITV